MRCILASAPPGAEEWREQAFPLIRTSDGFEAAASVGSAQIFELTPIAASQLRGWPIYEGGRYFSGGNDVWVIIPNGDVIKVIKPLETDPNTKQLPAVYICKT